MVRKSRSAFAPMNPSIVFSRCLNIRVVLVKKFVSFFPKRIQKIILSLPTSVIIGTLQPYADPLLSTRDVSLNSRPVENAFLALSLNIPTPSSKDIAFKFSDARIDSLSASFGSSALLAVEGERKTTMSARLALTARRSARQNGEPCKRKEQEKCFGMELIFTKI